MADGTRIDDVTPDTSVGGGELIPVSDSGTAKSVTTARLKDFVVDCIKNATGAESVTPSLDSVFILQSGAMKPMEIDTFADAIIGYAFDRPAVSQFTASDIISVENSGTAKTATVGDLAEYIRQRITPPEMDIGGLDEAEEFPGDYDWVPVGQEEEDEHGEVQIVPRRVALMDFFDAIFGRIAGWITSSSNNIDDDDRIVIVDANGSMKKVKKSDSGLATGNVKGPASTSINRIPQWDSETRKLKDGLTLTQEVDSTSQSTEIPSASAVHSAINGLGAAKAPSTNTDGNIPQWDGANSKTLKNGLAVSASVNGDSTDSQVPTAKAVNSAVEAKRARAFALGHYNSWSDIPTAGFSDGDIGIVSLDNGYKYFVVYITIPNETLHWAYADEIGRLTLGGAS